MNWAYFLLYHKFNFMKTLHFFSQIKQLFTQLLSHLLQNLFTNHNSIKFIKIQHSIATFILFYFFTGTHLMAQLVSFQPVSLNQSQQIFLNRSYSNYSVKSLNVNLLDATCHSSFLTGLPMTLQLNPSIQLSFIVTNRAYFGEEYLGPITEYSGYPVGTPTKTFKVRISPGNLFILIEQDGGPCYEIVSVSKEILFYMPINDAVIVREIPCIEFYDPEHELNPVFLCPEMYIYYAVVLTQAFVNKYPSQTEAVSAAYSAVNTAFLIWDNGLSFRKSRLYLYSVLKQDANGYTAIIINNKGERENSPSYYGCIETDVEFFFDTNLGFGGVSSGNGSICQGNIFRGGKIEINFQNSAEVMGITLAHEIGHLLGAGHLDNDSDCNNENCCEGVGSLMCSIGPNTLDYNKVTIFKSTFSEIGSYTGNHPCLCQPNNIADCEYCFSSSLSPDKNTLFVGCEEGSFTEVSVILKNGCDPYTGKRMYVSFSNGGFPIDKDFIVKCEAINIGDFESITHEDGLSWLETAELDWAPGQKREFKFLLKLVRPKADDKYCGSNQEFNLQSRFGSKTAGLLFTRDIKISYSYPLVLENNTNYLTLRDRAPSCFFANFTNCGALRREGNFRIQGDFVINIDHCFPKSHIFLDPGARIIVPTGKTLSLDNCEVSACGTDFWDAIVLEEGANLNIINSKISGAFYAVYKKGSGNITSTDKTNIFNCKNGIYCDDNASNVIIDVDATTFESITDIGLRVKNGTLNIQSSTFKDMQAGIVAEQSNVNMLGNNFISIGSNTLSDPSFTPPYSGNGITFMGTSTNKIGSLNSNTEPMLSYFEGMNSGIAINNGKYELQYLKMTRIGRGVHIKNSNTSGNFIKRLDINASQYGIIAKENGGMAANYEDNSIRVEDADASGIYVGGNTGNILIKNNPITNITGIAGVQVSSSSNVNINKNTINTEVTNGMHTDGIYIENSSGIQASCNVISCAAFGGGTSAFEVKESIGGIYNCNSMTGADCGLVFAGSCRPTIIGENVLSTHPVVGFVIATRSQGSDGVIGPQSHMGNHLAGSSTTKDAWNYGSPGVVLQSLISVSPISPFLPNNINDLISIGFFDPPQSATEFNCQQSNICPEGMGSRSKHIQNSVFLPSMDYIKDTLPMDSFKEARTWSLRKNTLEWIKLNSLNTNESKIWIDQYAGTDLDVYSDVTMILNSQNNSTQLLKNDFTMFNHLIHRIEASTPHSIYEKNQKTVSLIRLYSILNNRPLNQDEIKQLYDIAIQCPYSGGNAVYEARMCLEGIKPILVKEEDVCGLRSNMPKSQKDDELKLSVTPNPAHDELYIHLSGIQPGIIYKGFMASLNGKIVQHFNLKAINKIDISNFHAGVYVIHIQDHPQIVTRVVIE